MFTGNLEQGRNTPHSFPMTITHSFPMSNTHATLDATLNLADVMTTTYPGPHSGSYTVANVCEHGGVSSGKAGTGESLQVQVFDPAEVYVVRNKKREKKWRKKKKGRTQDERRADYRLKKRHRYDSPNWPTARRHGSTPSTARNKKNGIRRLRQKSGVLRIACKSPK